MLGPKCGLPCTIGSIFISSPALYPRGPPKRQGSQRVTRRKARGGVECIFLFPSERKTSSTAPRVSYIRAWRTKSYSVENCRALAFVFCTSTVDLAALFIASDWPTTLQSRQFTVRRRLWVKASLIHLLPTTQLPPPCAVRRALLYAPSWPGLSPRETA